MGKNRSHGKIDNLPEELRKEVENKLVSGYTYKDIVNYLKEMGHSVSKSAAQRFGEPFLKKFEGVRMAKEFAQLLTEDNAMRPTTELHEANNALISQIVMQIMVDNTDTFLSRLEEGSMQIINMTRWSTKDLCGRILDSEEAPEWYELKMKACTDEESGVMLCPSLLSFKTYMKKKRLASAEIHEANYQQEPVDIQGKLYTMIKTYTELPKDASGKVLYDRIINYTDTADTGKDFLCSINALEYNGEAYILNILYSDKPMSVTEPLTAEMFYKDDVNTAYIESNNGGGAFARNVERLIWEKYRTRKTVIRSFHQSQNKQSRILSNSSYVMEHIYFPVNWNNRFAEFYKAIMTYKAKGGNKHDDAPDTLTGIAESIGQGESFEFLT